MKSDKKKEKEELKKKDKKKDRKEKTYNYFKSLSVLADFSGQAAELLHETIMNFSAETIEEQMKKMHEIEHAADIAKHEMMGHLLKEFITPIDREDISTIAQEIDNVTDTIEDVLMQMYMFNIKIVREEAIEFSKIIVSSCRELKNAADEFHNYKKSSDLLKYIIDINNMEEDGDKMYMKAIRNLHTSSSDAIEIMSWTKLFDYLEKCCDATENVADVMEYVIMKNS